MSLFTGNDGPLRYRLDTKGKHLEALATKAMAEIRVAKTNLKALEDVAVGTVLATRTKRMREEALDKARKQRQDTPKARRALTFDA